MALNNEDDEDFEYGKEYVHTLDSAIAESSKLYPLAAGDIWPHWTEGVPTKLSRRLYSPSFNLGNVHHKERPYLETLEISWEREHLVETLENNYGLLPSSRYSGEWAGVYRIFIPDTTIGRVCESDPTGTLYIGRAGSERGWSILRSRVMQIAKREHHATRWWYTSRIGQKFSWSTVAIQWAFTLPKSNYKGETVPSSRMAESWLLSCYNDSFGEYPPLNQEG